MDNWIKSHLQEMNDFNVLFAIESGSRAWGMSSPDSDYDIRYIYHYSQSEYLSLFDKPPKTKSEFLHENGNEYDFVGWDIYKFLRLLGKSNPSTMEWLRSPICYLEHPVQTDLLEISHNFSRFSLFMHYQSMALSNFRKYIEDTVNTTIKKYLYVIRALLNAIYIDVKFKFPPLIIADCLLELEGESHWGIDVVSSDILEMLKFKQNASEVSSFEISSSVRFWISETLDQLDKLKEDVQKRDDYTISKSDLETVLKEIIT